MKHNVLFLTQLKHMLAGACPVVADAIVEEVSAIKCGVMREYTKEVNSILRKRLEALTDDKVLLAKGKHVLSDPENWDAVKYWLDDIHQYYTPVLIQAIGLSNESNTATEKEGRI